MLWRYLFKMSCQHGIICETYAGIEYDCALGLTIICENCPFGPNEKDALFISVEDGDIYYLTHSGEWASQELIDDIQSVFDEEILPILEMEDGIDELIAETKDTNKVKVIILTGVSVSYSEPGWYSSPDWHYEFGEREIEYDNLIIDEIY